MAISLRDSDSPLPTSALSCLSLQRCLRLSRAELHGEVALGRGLRGGGLEPEPQPGEERSGREGLPYLLQRREGRAKGPTSPPPANPLISGSQSANPGRLQREGRALDQK